MPPKLTNPLRPVARYRKGKLPQGATLPVESDSDDEDNQQRQAAAAAAGQDDDDAERDELIESVSSVRHGDTSVKRQQPRGQMNVALGNVQVDSSGAVKVGSQAAKESSSEYGELSTYLGLEGAYYGLLMVFATLSIETDSEEEEERPKPVFKSKAPAAAEEVCGESVPRTMHRC